MSDMSCGCPPLPHPRPPEIPAGLAALAARQGAGFPDYADAMLAAIPRFAALANWRARGEGDLGVMLLEAWAYVLDVTGFYDARIAERAYLPTAPDDIAAARLAALIGHRLRPAMAARVLLATEADGADPVLLPKGTAFRSAAFGKEKPQVFELPAPATIWPQRNRWRLAPIRDAAFDGTLRFLPRRAPSAGALLLLRSGATAAAARVVSVEPDPAPDGATYQRAVLDAAGTDAVAALAGQSLATMQVTILRLALNESPFVTSSASTSSLTTSTGITTITLDALYPQLRAGAWAVVEIGDTLHPVTLFSVWRSSVTIDSASGATMPVTAVTLSAELPRLSTESVTLHANGFDLGAPTRPGKTAIVLDDIQGGVALVPPVAPLGTAPATADAILEGAGKQGTLLPGTLVEAGDGAATYQPAAGILPFPVPLLTPLVLRGNVVEAVRGETVIDEILGSGNAATPFQVVSPKKAPLAWIEDSSQPDGRRPELTVRVDGLLWTRVDTFFGQAPDARVYVVRTEGDGSTTIRFGDGTRGARPPSGVGNIRADYRWGAGAAKPPPGSIAQIAVPVAGLKSVRGPLPATGGADAETGAELRSTAPASALTLGRAVSLQDFEALARGFPGVLNASAAWVWDEQRQRAAVKLWIIPDGGDPAASLRGWLAAQAVPDLVIAVEAAAPAAASTLAISLDTDAAFDAALVTEAARTALLDPEDGLLAPRNQRIGGVLFRSVLSHRLHQVPGVVAVAAILLDGAPMPAGIAAGQGHWFDLDAGTTVS